MRGWSGDLVTIPDRSADPDPPCTVYQAPASDFMDPRPNAPYCEPTTSYWQEILESVPAAMLAPPWRMGYPARLPDGRVDCTMFSSACRAAGVKGPVWIHCRASAGSWPDTLAINCPAALVRMDSSPMLTAQCQASAT